MTRKEAIKNYYDDPNYCLQCSKILEIPEGISPSEIRRKKFCNTSCAATYNNLRRVKKIDENVICPTCGNTKDRQSKQCRSCSNKQKQKIQDKTLGYFVKDKSYSTTRCAEVRKHAQKVLMESNVDKVCAYCHEYDLILEVHHIKGIMSFDYNTLISIINDVSNLVYLCPNHYAMIEKGLISLDL